MGSNIVDRKYQSFLILAILLIAVFFHFYRLGLIEFLGEDEAQVMSKVVRLLHWQTDIRNAGALLTTSHPPVRYLVSLPFVAIFGTTEFWIRFPHALAGLLSVYWVYRLGQLIFNRVEIGLIAALITAVSGISSTYKSANGIGIFTLLLLIGLEFLIRYRQADLDEDKIKWLNYVSLSLGLATITFLEGVMFVFAIGLLIVVWKPKLRTLIWPCLIYGGILGGYLIVWHILPAIAVYLNLLPPVAGNNSGHLIQRLSEFGAFNLGSLIGSLSATNSIFFVIMALCFITLQRNYLWKQASTAIVYFLPHSFIWLFGFRVPCGHGAYVTPLLALLFGGGFWALWQAKTSVGWHWLMGAGLALTIFLTGWQTYLVNLQGSIERSWKNLVYFDDNLFVLPCGAPDFRVLGQTTAGLFVRDNGKPNEYIVTDFGGSMELYYAGLPHLSETLDDLKPHLSDPSLMKEKGIHFLVVREPEAVTPYLIAPPSAIVSVNDIETLFIYDLWKTSAETQLLESGINRPQFYRKYGTWQRIRPVSGSIQP